MKNHLIVFLPFLLLWQCAKAQELVVDPTTSAAILVNSAVINGQLNTTNNNLSLIQKGQLAVTGQLVIVNKLQNDIYTGLSQVASVINNLTTIKEIADCGTDIISDVRQSATLAESDPVLLLFAEQGAREFETRAVTLATDVSAFVLKSGGSNLMDSGERGKLLNHIEREMEILRGIAYGMQRAMYWAKINGLWRSLNPWATWQNEDVRIANDVINSAKYLKAMRYLLLTLFAFCFTLSAYSQQSTIDVVGMHQLIIQSQDEHSQQVTARNNQATVTANEQANLTLLEKLKNMYRTLQQRYNTLGTAITIADIGLEAEPMVKQIINYQGQIVALAEKQPAIAFLGVQTEIEFAEQAEGLTGYVTGLTLSIGDVNQMKASDRKILFDYVIFQLSQIQELSGNLVNTLTYSNLSTLLRSINPFQNYIDADKSMAESIIQNAKYLKQ